MQTTINSVATNNLHIAYEQTGTDSGEPILLLHGFPYDFREYDEVRDRIAGSHRRIIVPYLRGFGPTRYRPEQVVRSGQQGSAWGEIATSASKADLIPLPLRTG